MNKEDYLKRISEFKISNNSKKMFAEQIDLFYNRIMDNHY